MMMIVHRGVVHRVMLVGSILAFQPECLPVERSQAAAEDASGRSSPPALFGIWEHDPCVVAQGADGKATSSRATFAFFEREWGLSFSQYSDGVCHSKVLTAMFRGTYALTGASERLPGVTDATFRFTYKGMALYDPG